MALSTESQLLLNNFPLHLKSICASVSHWWLKITTEHYIVHESTWPTDSEHDLWKLSLRHLELDMGRRIWTPWSTCNAGQDEGLHEECVRRVHGADSLECCRERSSTRLIHDLLRRGRKAEESVYWLDMRQSSISQWQLITINQTKK